MSLARLAVDFSADQNTPKPSCLLWQLLAALPCLAQSLPHLSTCHEISDSPGSVARCFCVGHSVPCSALWAHACTRSSVLHALSSPAPVTSALGAGKPEGCTGQRQSRAAHVVVRLPTVSITVVTLTGRQLGTPSARPWVPELSQGPGKPHRHGSTTPSNKRESVKS